ncbi:unnamed protein product, partial [Polarella glacialis]
RDAAVAEAMAKWAKGGKEPPKKSAKQKGRDGTVPEADQKPSKKPKLAAASGRTSDASGKRRATSRSPEDQASEADNLREMIAERKRDLDRERDAQKRRDIEKDIEVLKKWLRDKESAPKNDQKK